MTETCNSLEFFEPRKNFRLDENYEGEICGSFEYRDGVVFLISKKTDQLQTKIVDIQCRNKDGLIIRQSEFHNNDTTELIYSDLHAVYNLQNFSGDFSPLTQRETTTTDKLPDYIKRVNP
jgi:hypothetical protein